MEVKTQVAGNMWKILVNEGDMVTAGDTLFIMEVMKMEVPHEAPIEGKITKINITEGDEGLDADATVLEISD